jgi:hypothetical protein
VITNSPLFSTLAIQQGGRSSEEPKRAGQEVTEGRKRGGQEESKEKRGGPEGVRKKGESRGVGPRVSTGPDRAPRNFGPGRVVEIGRHHYGPGPGPRPNEEGRVKTQGAEAVRKGNKERKEKEELDELHLTIHGFVLQSTV